MNNNINNNLERYGIIKEACEEMDEVSIELNVIDDITDTTPETIAELDYRWTTSAGGYYNGNFSNSF